MKFIICIVFFSLVTCFEMSPQNKDLVEVKFFVSKNKVVFRFIPKSKAAFDEMSSKAMQMIRYENNSGVLTNSVVVAELIRSYYNSDTLNWMRLYRKDKDKTGFVYNSLYPQKSNEKINTAEKVRFNKMIFDLTLLSCDLDKEIAKACGLYLMDTTLNNNLKYTYLLSVYTHSKSETTQPVSTINVDGTQLSVNTKVQNVKGKSKNSKCTIEWKAIDYRSEYSGYNIYRSEDSTTYRLVNKAPVILINSQFEKNKQSIYYQDSLPLINKKYYYYVKGINFFGEESPPSSVVVVYNSPTIRTIPFIDTIKTIQNRFVKLSWRMEDQRETELIEKFIVQKSDKDKGFYKTIRAGQKPNVFTDSFPLATNYYRIGGVTNNGLDTLFSHSRISIIIDTIPPGVVTNGHAKSDQKGIVKITWSKCPENDIRGYKVFRSNRPEDEFVQINSNYVSDTFFIDKITLNTLSKKVYYKIVASDKNHNSSAFSELIVCSRPDTTPPVAPIISEVRQFKNGIKVGYILSTSDDVVSQGLYRKLRDEISYKEIMKLGNNGITGIYTDTLTENGNEYIYKLKAEDGDGNVSFSKPLGFFFETGFRKKVDDINYNVDRTDHKIDLTWVYNESGVDKFIIYRAKQGELFTIIKTLQGDKNSYTDKNLHINNLYIYKIKATMNDGTESIISKEIKIEY